MQYWKEMMQWIYGDVLKSEGFWYSHPLKEISDLDEEQLFWVPDENSLCLLWHAGHIAHRERTHIAMIIRGIDGEIIPSPYEVFGPNWCSVEKMRKSIDSADNVMRWIENVRNESKEFISSLSEADFRKKPDTANGLTIGHWLFVTAAHGALHIGKMQILRNMLLQKRDNPC